MEAARVVDEVVGPFSERRIEDGAALEIHRGAGLLRPLPGPLDRRCREVNGVDAASQACQVGSVPPVPASQLEHTSRSERAFAEPLTGRRSRSLPPTGRGPAARPRNEVLVGPFDEERARLGAVCEELVPPGAACARQQGIEHAQQVVAGVDELVLHLSSLSDPHRGPGALGPLS